MPLQAVFCHDVRQALRNVCYCDITFLARYGHFLKTTDSVFHLNNANESLPLNFRQYAVLLALPHNIEIVM